VRHGFLTITTEQDAALVAAANPNTPAYSIAQRGALE
jgi:hypothetical protein